MAWPEPQYSKSRIRQAGKMVAHTYQRDHFLAWGINIPTNEYAVIENWRTSHGAVLNTAQACLRRLEATQRPVIGQRLKRFTTLIDKLQTGRSKDLSTMHDIAGVRAIFRSIEDLNNFRERMRQSKAAHRLMHDPEKFDYIANPKATGYRGIHDVMERVVSSPVGVPWNGMKFEVQLRTAVQHAWATAVEIYDDTQSARFKFQESTSPSYRQFLVVSEIFARIHEGQYGCLPECSDSDLANEFSELEQKTHTVTIIHGLQVAKNHRSLHKNSILQRKTDGSLYIYNFPSLPSALKSIASIEQLPETLNAVLVGSKTPSHIRDAFRNYFEDTSDFIKLLDDALLQIRGKTVIDEWHRTA